MSAGFPSLLQSFFSDRLLRQRQASPHTIAGYRDSFRLLFQFAKQRLSKAPSSLTLDDLNPSFVGDFLDDLESRRKNSARTRNIRLAALHSFFQYVALEEPAHACAALPANSGDAQQTPRTSAHRICQPGGD